MNELASLFLAASVTAGFADHRDMASVLRQAPVPKVKMSQALGQSCVTSNGTCRIPPRPVNTQCFCGNVLGVVQP
jgi:hypothetical protein